MKYKGIIKKLVSKSPYTDEYLKLMSQTDDVYIFPLSTFTKEFQYILMEAEKKRIEKKGLSLEEIYKLYASLPTKVIDRTMIENYEYIFKNSTDGIDKCFGNEKITQEMYSNYFAQKIKDKKFLLVRPSGNPDYFEEILTGEKIPIIYFCVKHIVRSFLLDHTLSISYNIDLFQKQYEYYIPIYEVCELSYSFFTKLVDCHDFYGNIGYIPLTNYFYTEITLSSITNILNKSRLDYYNYNTVENIISLYKALQDNGSNIYGVYTKKYLNECRDTYKNSLEEIELEIKDENEKNELLKKKNKEIADEQEKMEIKKKELIKNVSKGIF